MPSSQDGFSLPKLLAILRRRRRLAVVVGVAVTAFLWGKALVEKPLFEGSFKILVEDISQDSKPQLPIEGGQVGLLKESDFETLTQLMQSPKLLDAALKGQFPDFDASQLQVMLVPGTKIIVVRYTALEPRRAEAILSALSVAYLDYSRKRELLKLNEGLNFLEQQFPGLELKVNSLEIELEKFRQRYNFVDPGKQGEELVAQLNSYNQQVRVTEEELAQQQTRYQTLQQQVRLTPNAALNAVPLSESSRYQGLLNDLLDLDKKIALETARVQPGDPILLALLEKKAQLKPLLDQEARRLQGQRSSGVRSGQLTPISLDLAKQLVGAANEIKVLRRRQSILSAQRQMLQRQFAQYPILARQYGALERKLAVAEGNLKNFLEARERFRLEAAQKTVPWELIAPPSVSTVPVSLPRNLGMGLVLGSLAGIGASVLRDRLDHVYHSPQEVKEELKVPLLAALPYLSVPPEQPNSVPAGTQRTDAIPDQRYLEACRSFYTNLRFLGADKPICTLAIGSAMPAEGKSTVASQLAKTAVSMGQRVLLVDADLRKPKLHKRLHLDNVLGLSNVLTGSAVLDQAIQRVDDGLTVLTSGQRPPDPTRLLASDRMTQLIEYLKSSNEYDLVIFDTPQLLGLADTSSFAKALDGLILVVSLDKVDRNAPKEAMQHLQFANIVLLGMVTNAITERSGAEQGTDKAAHYYYPPSSPDYDEDLETVKPLKQGPISLLQRASKSAWNWLESR